MPNQTINNLKEWEVEMAVSGAITIKQPRMVLHVEKGVSHPFLTTVTISKVPHGCRMTMIARAYTQETANDAAVYFLGQALDILCIKLNIPLYLSLFQPEFRSSDSHIRRLVSQEEWENAFIEGRRLGIDRRFISRAISWYRKGLISDDPIDKVIAYWSALEAVASNFYRPTNRTKLGVINQICDCFVQLWGPVPNWKVIPGEPDIINQFHDFRNGFSHGFKSVDIDTIREVLVHLPRYESLVYTFLFDWINEGYKFECSTIVQEGLQNIS